LDISTLPVPDPKNDFTDTNPLIPSLPVADTPAVTPPGSNFTGAQNLTLTCTTPGAAIYYTLNGNEPTTSSTLYTAPFQITSNVTLKAIAVATGCTNSQILTVSYNLTGVQNYVKNIYISADSKDANARAGLQTQTTDALTSILKDLNSGAKGDYIYLGYTLTPDNTQGITGLIMDNKSGSKPPATVNYSGVTYTLINVDLNAGAGGDFIWLYYTKDSRAGKPITNLFVQIGTDTSISCLNQLDCFS